MRYALKMRPCLLIAVAIVATASPAPAQTTRSAEPKVEQRSWTIDGVERTGLLVVPAAAAGSKPEAAKKWPVVFVFHGHGGSGRQVRRASGLDTLMPDAIFVYLNGLPTKGRRVDPDGKMPGWQSTPGEQGDRDLRFFDAVWIDLKQSLPVDTDHVFMYGHSNGGLMVFTLWAARGDVFHAVAVSGSLPLMRTTELKPKPALHIAGKTDPLAPFAAQERWMKAARAIDGCAATSTPWGDRGEVYASPTNTPFYDVIYDGGHAPPRWAYPMIVKFFEAQSR